MLSLYIKNILKKNNMGKEVRTYFNRAAEDPRYLGFKIERNGSIAERVAQHIGLPYNKIPLYGPPHEKTYVVPGTVLSQDMASQLLIETERDLYGTTTPITDHVGKSILHVTMAENPPSFYQQEFAKTVEARALVLPGLTVFSPRELEEAYAIVGKPKNLYRLKAANDSDGNGQYLIEDMNHLHALLAKIGEDVVTQQGLVIEPNLLNNLTVSAGQFELGDDRYVFVANQKNGSRDGRDAYLGGNNIVVARGGFNELLNILERRGDTRMQSVQKADLFLKLYFEHFKDLISSRISVDVLSGTHPHYNERLSGVTDITPRLGGLCPATILAALQLQQHPRQEAVVAQVNLNYNPKVNEQYEEGATFFMNQEPLRISAKIDEII